MQLVLSVGGAHEAPDRRGAHPVDTLSLFVILKRVVVLVLLLVLNLLIEVLDLDRHLALV